MMPAYEAVKWTLNRLNTNNGQVGGVAVFDSYVPGIKIGTYPLPFSSYLPDIIISIHLFSLPSYNASIKIGAYTLPFSSYVPDIGISTW